MRMMRISSRTTLAVGALSIAVAAREVHDRAACDPRVLVPAQPMERRLSRGVEHRYRFDLNAGEYAAILVEQRGIDVTARILGSARNGIADVAEIDDEPRLPGLERIELVADVSGPYTVILSAARGIVTPGAYTIRLESRRAATDADRSMQDARRCRTTAARLDTDGRFDDARRVLEHALQVAERERGADDAVVAAIASQLAGEYRKLPDGARSEALYKRAIAIMDRTLGPRHPTTAYTKSQLALLYQREGDRLKAETLLRESLDVIETTLGTAHPWYVSALATLGSVYDRAGDLDEAEAIVRRALAILERNDDTKCVQYAALLNNLGEVYRQRQDYGRAETVLRQSLVLDQRLLGAENYSVATALQNLAIVARERKDYATAVDYNRRALEIRERMVGLDHPDVAHILTNLGNIYRATGDTTRSLDMHFRALHIWESAAGPYQQATLLSVGNIAKTYAAAGDLSRAIAYQRRADAILEKELSLNLAVGSERQKLAFVSSVSERTDRTISLHLRDAPADPDAAALAALVVLQRKGRVLDAMVDTLAAVRRRLEDPVDRRLLDRLHATTADLARLALSVPDRQSVARQTDVGALDSKMEHLEAELSERSAAFRAHMQPVTLESVEAALPERAALVEFAVFRPFDPRAERNTEAYGPPHYAAYIIRKGVAPRGLDLGAAAAIDGAVEALRAALRDPARPDLQGRSRAVDELVLRPLRAAIGHASRLLISPDGALQLIPFDALVDERGRYAIERYAISYLTSGRDVLRLQARRASHGQPVVFADPAFGESGQVSPRYFSPLAVTAEEARAIKGLFPDAVVFTGARASKATLQHVEAPPILHIASHGFFLREDDGSHQPHPLLRSGVALAGANLSREAPDAGILTALEAAHLNLWGTRLVTLSACNTGIGEVKNGEGVYGLRRAFVLAGAESIVMSLWPVSDAITRGMMVAYYTGLRAGLGRGDALRKVKLAMLKVEAERHPFYWASFIQSGEWASLDGRR